MVTPEEIADRLILLARQANADSWDRMYEGNPWAEFRRNVNDLADKVERLEAQRKLLREALHGMCTRFHLLLDEDWASLAKARAALKETE